MRTPYTNKSSGFMLIQLLIGITIIIVISSITAVSLSAFIHQQALNNDTDEVTALFSEARARTLASDGGLSFGVHLESGKAVLFSGASYIPSASYEKTVLLDPAIDIESITLTGGGSEVLFDQGTGNTENYGTFIVKKSASAAGAKTITITQTGQVSSN